MIFADEVTLTGSLFPPWLQLVNLILTLALPAWIGWQKSKQDAQINLLKTDYEKCEKERKNYELRLVSLEVDKGVDIPSWKKSHDGIVISVTPGFIRLFCSPYGYSSRDIIGKKFTDLNKLSQSMIKSLEDMDMEVHRRGRAVKHSVEIYPSVFVTIMKIATATIAGDIVYVGYAMEED